MNRPKTLLELAGAPKQPVLWEKSVLLLIDHQQEYAKDGGLPLTGIDAAVDEIGRLLAAARAEGTPVIHVQQMGRPGGLFDPTGPRGAFISAIRPLDGEAVVQKTLPNSFTKTSLDETLRKIGRNELIVAGFMTHMCVSATVRNALDHGYRTSVVASACATRDLPDQLGSGVIPAADLHRTALAELGDRFATILPNAAAIAARAAA